jgi:hypothetical protein
MAFRLKDSYILVLLSLLFLALVVIPRLSYPELDHGDEFSDASVLASGKNFVKFGFIRCRFLPVAEPHLDKPSDPYTHAPPLSDITNGLLRKFFKTDSLVFFRSIALFFSLLNILFWYLFVRRFSNSYLAAFLAALFYFTNPFFIYGADSLYQNAYSDFLRVFIFYMFLRALVAPEKRRNSLIAVSVLFAFETAYTFEYIIYLGIFFFFFRYLYNSEEQKLRVKYIFALMLIPVLVIALHFFQNAWYFGSFKLAYLDLKNIAIERIVHSKDSPLGHLSLSNWWNYVLSRYLSLAFLFDFYILFPFMLFCFILYRGLAPEKRTTARRMFYLFLLLFVSGISWYIIFPSHALAHTFVLFLPRHLVPAAALFFALCCYIAWHFIKKENPRNVLGRIALVAVIIAICARGLLKSELPLSAEKINQSKDFLTFKQCLLNIRQKGSDKDDLGINYYRFPFIRYYTNRRCKPVFDRPGLENLPSLPGYFIFIPQNNPANQELFRFLNQKYTQLFACKSSRFPSIFFKLKK